MKKIKYIFLIISFNFLFLIFLIEIVGPFFSDSFKYRYLPQKIISSHFENSKTTEFTLKKNFSAPFIMSEAKFNSHVTTDEFGQRITSNNIPDVEKIYIFGDSFTFGFGVNDNQTVPYFIQEKISDYSFINLGFSAGRDLSSYYTWLKKNIKIKKITRGILILYINDLNDLIRNRCFNLKNIEVKLTSEECVNIKSNYYIYGGKLYNKKSFFNYLFHNFHTYLKRSYSIALFRMYYDYLFSLNKNSVNKKINDKLSKEEKEKIQFIVNYFNDKIDLLGIVMIDYSEENKFYDYISKISRTKKIKTIKIEPLNLKYKIGINDPHHNALGNKLLADRIIKEIF